MADDGTPIGVAVSGSLLALAIAVLAMPLRDIRRRTLVEEHRLQIEVCERIEATIARIHGAVEGVIRRRPLGARCTGSAGHGARPDREAADSAWRPATAGAGLSVTVLPVVLFVIQRLIVQAI